jgi:hypothetical protein
MTDLAARLTEALDRAEQALAGCGTDWATDSGGDWLTFGNAPGAVPVSGYVYDESLDGAAIAAHMVAWQPAVVLRLITRDRALLAANASTDRNVADHVARCGPDLCGCRDYLATTTTLQMLTTAVQAAAKFWLPEEPADV